MCDCINEVRGLLHERMQPHQSLYFTSTCTNTQTGQTKFALPFEYDYKDKNGKIKTKRSFVAATYCPICGERYEEEQDG